MDGSLSNTDRTCTSHNKIIRTVDDSKISHASPYMNYILYLSHMHTYFINEFP